VSNTVSSALGVYCVLTEVASDKGSEEFQTTHAWIARMSGLGIRTVQQRLKELCEIGLVEIQTPDLRAPSTYRLKPVQQPLPNDMQPLPSVRHLTKKASLPTSEQILEETLEERDVAQPLPNEDGKSTATLLRAAYQKALR